jgi:phosphoribosylformimino-5-aminoimidazole carboxamide ribotide isomerase
MDVLNGLVVRAYRGERDKYRPIESPLTNSSDPVRMAKVLLDITGQSSIYVADLNAIQKRGNNFDILRTVQEATKAILWIDAGTGTLDDVICLMSEIPFCKVVVGSETLESGEEFEKIARECPMDRVIFSLDIKEDKILTRKDSPFCGVDPEEGVDLLKEAGWKKVIILTLDGVGTGRGLPLHMYKRVIQRAPEISFYGGGGFSSRDELFALKKLNMAGLLVATALHEGRITKKDIEELAS